MFPTLFGVECCVQVDDDFRVVGHGIHPAGGHPAADSPGRAVEDHRPVGDAGSRITPLPINFDSFNETRYDCRHPIGKRAAPISASPPLTSHPLTFKASSDQSSVTSLAASGIDVESGPSAAI